MAKIPRFTLLPFAQNVNAAADIGQFGSGATGSPVYTAVLATIQALTAWTTGWAAETVANNRPFLEDMNAVCYVFGQALCYILQMGIPEWDSGTTYYTNSVVQYAGVCYQSLIDTNLNVTPVVGASWKLLIPPISGILGAPVTKSVSTLYQAATDGFIIGWGEYGAGAEVAITIGTTSGLGNEIANAQSASVGGQVIYDTLCTLIPKGYYWQAIGSGGGSLNSNLQWISIGS